MSDEPAAPTQRRYATRDDLQALLALLDVTALRADEMAKTYETLVVEPSGPEDFFIPHIYPLGWEAPR